VVQHTLPTFPTRFIGRVAEITELNRLLANPDCRLLTLVGPGGSGKTRLAVEIARGSAEKFPDGVFFVPLQPLQAADQVLPALIDALPLQVTEDPEATLLDYLHDKQMLLILDNLEHLLASAPLLSQILAEAPQVKLLVTSRAMVNLQGEWVRMVAGLTYPDDGQLAPADNYSAVELFADCAQHLRDDFALTEDYAPVVRICQLVDGMPLALELAAGWTPVLTSDEIADEIQRGLAFLSRDAHDLPERHRSMHAVFDHSWRLLTEDEQAVMRRFAVFWGGCTREAAEQVTGASLKTLARLVTKSMLRHDAHTGRYDVQELLRQYAHERLLAAGDSAAAQVAHAHYYAGFMTQRAKDVKGRRQIAALDEIEADWNNVRTAWEWGLAHRDWDGVGPMMETLHLFCDMRARYFDGERLFQAAVAALEPGDGEPPHRLWGELLVRSAEVLQLPETNEMALRSMPLLDRAEKEANMGDDPLYLWVRGRAANLDLNTNPFSPEAIPLLEASLAGFRARDDRYYLSRALRWLSYSYLMPLISTGHITEQAYQTYLDHFRHYNQACLDLTRALGDDIGLAHPLYYHGLMLFNSNQYDEAERDFREASAIWRKAGDRKSVAVVNMHLSLRFWFRGEFDQYRPLLEETVRLTTEANFPYIRDSAWNALAEIAGLEGDYQTGREILQRLPPIDPPRLGLYIAACGLGEYEQVHTHLRQALRYYAANPNPWGVMCFPFAAILLARAGEYTWATEVLGRQAAQRSHPAGWVQNWECYVQLCADLETRLGVEAYTTAWERGAQRDLAALTNDLLAYFDSDHTTAQQRANESLAEPLTERELDVLARLAQGRSNRQIAAELVITVGTVKRYVYDICQKLDAQNRTEAASIARSLGLLS
jgi:predicted ATPase/DNA-binding CsgD family transcriptional regulator